MNLRGLQQLWGQNKVWPQSLSDIFNSLSWNKEIKVSPHFPVTAICYFSSLFSKIKVKLNRQTVKSADNHLFPISMVAIQGLSSACETSLLLLWWGFPAGLGHMHSWSRRVLIKNIICREMWAEQSSGDNSHNWQPFTVRRIRRFPPSFPLQCLRLTWSWPTFKSHVT